MTKDKKPVKVPKGDVLVEFVKDVNELAKKGMRKVTTKDTADILVSHKKAKIIKEFAEGEIMKMVKAGKNYLNVKESKGE